MKLDGVPSRTIWLERDGWSVGILDQTLLPHKLVRLTLKTVDEAAHAIKSMQVRGAPLIGVTAAYGVALAMRVDASDASLAHVVTFLGEQRPTAVNLRWALEDLRATLGPLAVNVRAAAAYARAAELADEDVETCRRIGINGLKLIKDIADKRSGRPVNVLDPLQRRLARLRRLGDCDVADLSGARCGRFGSCVGRRNPPAQSGCGSHGLRAFAARRSA